MMFGDEVSQKFLSKWSTFFKPKIIADCKSLKNIDELLSATEPEPEDNNGQYKTFWLKYIFQCYTK